MAPGVGGAPGEGGHAMSGGASASGGGSPGTGGQGGGRDAPPVAYANSFDALYAFDASGEESLVGPLEGCEGKPSDLAQASDGRLFVVSVDSLYRVELPATTCTLVAAAAGTFPNSLAFLPPGILDDAETLVGYRERTYLRVDLTTGNVTEIGDLGVAEMQSSGDLLWYQGRLVLTVTGPGCNDCLVDVDPVAGYAKSSLGSLSHGSVFGLAAWEGSLFGFTGMAELLHLDTSTGVSSLVTETSVSWLGATSLGR